MSETTLVFTSDLAFLCSNDDNFYEFQSDQISSLRLKVLHEDVIFVLKAFKEAIFISERISIDSILKRLNPRPNLSLKQILAELNLGIELDNYLVPRNLGIFKNMSKKYDDLYDSYKLHIISPECLLDQYFMLETRINLISAETIFSGALALKVEVLESNLSNISADLLAKEKRINELESIIVKRNSNIITTGLAINASNLSEKIQLNNCVEKPLLNPMEQIIESKNKKEEQSKAIFENQLIGKKRILQEEDSNLKIKNNGDELLVNDINREDDLHPKRTYSYSKEKSINYEIGIKVCIRLSGLQYAVGCIDGSIHFRNMNTHELTDCLPKEHISWIQTMIEIEDLLVSGGSDSKIKVWKIKEPTQKSITTLSDHTNSVFALVQIKGKIVASGSADKSIKIWDITTSSCLISLNNHTNSIYGLLMYDKKTLLSVSNDKTIRLWDVTIIQNSKEIEKKRITEDRQLLSVIQLNETNYAVGTFHGKINIWNIEKGVLVGSLVGHTAWISQLIKLNSTMIASYSQDKSIKIWNIETNREIQELERNTAKVTSLMSLDTYLISTSEDLCLHIWKRA